MHVPVSNKALMYFISVLLKKRFRFLEYTHKATALQIQIVKQPLISPISVSAKHIIGYYKKKAGLFHSLETTSKHLNAGYL